MKCAHVLGRVAEVRRLAEEERDFEAAHGAEDQLHQSVLDCIANGNCEDDPADLARIALRTTALAFPRWFA